MDFVQVTLESSSAFLQREQRKVQPQENPQRLSGARAAQRPRQGKGEREGQGQREGDVRHQAWVSETTNRTQSSGGLPLLCSVCYLISMKWKLFKILG